MNLGQTVTKTGNTERRKFLNVYIFVALRASSATNSPEFDQMERGVSLSLDCL